MGTWNNWQCHLFQNNLVVSDTTVIGDFVECDFHGYSYQVITGWAGPYRDAGTGAYTHAGIIQWVADGGDLPQSIYGYYVTDESGVLAWCQNDPDAPYVLSAAGQVYVVVPYYDLASQF